MQNVCPLPYIIFLIEELGRCIFNRTRRLFSLILSKLVVDLSERFSSCVMTVGYEGYSETSMTHVI